MNKVFVLGSINCDLVIGADRMPQAGETLSGNGFFVNPGGKGANQAVACSKLGADTYLIGAIGDDLFGQICFNSLVQYGCGVDFVKKVAGVSTGVASIWVIEGDNRILLDGGANFHLEEKDVLSVLESQACAGDILVSQLEINPDLVEKAFHFAKQLGMRTLLNPAPAPVGGVSAALLKDTDIIAPNKTETEILCGFAIKNKNDLKQAAKQLIGQGVSEVLITLGEEGAYYQSDNKEKFGTIFPIKVVDTTAAGDSTIGALAYKLSVGETVWESMEFCAAASAITVNRKGAQRSIPTLEEVNDFLQIKNM